MEDIHTPVDNLADGAATRTANIAVLAYSASLRSAPVEVALEEAIRSWKGRPQLFDTLSL
jgi:hypothetical protein